MKNNKLVSYHMVAYDKKMADKFSERTAIIYHEIFNWCNYQRENKNNKQFYEGKHWMYSSYKSLMDKFGYSENTIGKAIKQLKNEGYIAISHRSYGKFAHTNWYSITSKICEMDSSYRIFPLYEFLLREVEDGYCYVNRKEAFEIIKQTNKEEKLINISVSDELLSDNPYLKKRGEDYNLTSKKEESINIIKELNIIKEDKNSINTIVTANAVTKTNDIESSSKQKEKQNNPIENQKELNPIENKEENIPTKEESKKQFSKTQPKTDLELSADFLPNQWEKENKKYPRVIDMETKKPEPRFSQGDYDKTVGFVNTWAKHGGTKHKITEYDDASNKTFMFILETMKFHSSNILEYFKKGNWNKKWLSNLKLTEESLKRAVETRGSDEESFRYACGKHFQYIQQGLTKVDFRILPKGFDKFLKTTQKDGSEISWLLYHIVSQGTAHVAKDDYFWNTHEIPEDVKRQVIGFTKDIKDWFKGSKSEKSIINWANYIYATNCKVWELKPSTRYSNQSKDLITLFGALKDIIHHGDMRTNKEPSWFTLGLAFESQKTLLEKLQIRALRDFVDKFTEISNSEQKKQLPWYKKD